MKRKNKLFLVIGFVLGIIASSLPVYFWVGMGIIGLWCYTIKCINDATGYGDHRIPSKLNFIYLVKNLYSKIINWVSKDENESKE